MKKLITLFLPIALLISAAPAAASVPDDITIVSTVSFSEAYGTFDAFGPAVEAGVICASGEVYDLSNRATGWQNGAFTNLFVHKLFTCADGSGAFEMDLNVRLDFSTMRTTATWRVVAGDADYTRLHGTGKLTGEPVEGGIVDTYTGRLHID